MCRLVLTATAAADTTADIAKRFALAPDCCWTAEPVREEFDLRVLRCTGSAGDVRAQAEVVKLLAAGAPLAKARCTLVYCAFRTQADQVRPSTCSGATVCRQTLQQGVDASRLPSTASSTYDR